MLKAMHSEVLSSRGDLLGEVLCQKLHTLQQDSRAAPQTCNESLPLKAADTDKSRQGTSMNSVLHLRGSALALSTRARKTASAPLTLERNVCKGAQCHCNMVTLDIDILSLTEVLDIACQHTSSVCCRWPSEAASAGCEHCHTAF